MSRNWIFWILVTGLIISACAPASKSSDSASSASQSEPATVSLSSPSPLSTATLLPEEQPPIRAQSKFTTDFIKHYVPYSEILSGGPPKDGIAAIDEPKFISVNEAEEWLKDREPVVFVKVGDDIRAYPIPILIWHEIVKDTVEGEPLIVSFCPLCNTAIAFKRTFDGQVFDFGTTGG